MVVKQFLDFVREKGVIGLAVAFVLGVAVNDVVSAFVNDLLNPIIGIFLGKAETLKQATFMLGPAEIRWGNFLTVLIDFLIIVAIVYYLVKVLEIEKLDKKKK